MNKFFNCHGCGKCCNSAPMLEVSDVFNYNKDFIVSLYMKVFLVRDVKNIDLRNHYDKIFLRHTNFQNQECFIQLSPTGYFYNSLGKCPQLQQNGNCGIYDRRPLMCKTVPVSATIPEDQQFLHDVQSDFFIKEGCLTSEPKEGFIPIYQEGKLHSSFQENRLILIEEMERNKRTTANIVNIMKELAPEMLIPNNNSHRTMHLLFLLSSMLKEQLLDKNQIKLILENQIILLTDGISKALIRKDKNDREQTKEFRVYLSIYEDTLKDYDNNPLFNSNLL